jgi:cell wall-associated NlpC family hydrolase
VTQAAALTEAVQEFTRAHAGMAVRAIDLEVAERDGRPLVSGTVLTSRQGREVRDLARRHGAMAELVIAADPRSGMEEAWAAISVPLLDLWRGPSRAGQEMGRQTQYLDRDGPLRRFGTDGGFALVQGPDLAMGWAALDALRETIPSPEGHPWAAVSRAREGAARGPATTGAGVAATLERARSELGVAYVWGGTTHAGFDCSGLVQRVLVESTGVLLPRHTGDQRRVGARVLTPDARAGDLLFATPRDQRVGHVLLMTSAESVLHACRTEQRVIEEPLAVNAQRYQHQGWRRPVELEAS